MKTPDTSMDKQQARALLGIAAPRRLITVIGGSQGAEPLNRHLRDHIQWYQNQESLSLIWQCGVRHLDRYRGFHQPDHHIRVHGFLHDMNLIYAATDLVVSRAGALTITELASTGTPAILVPLPTAAANHQYYNAVSYSRQGAALVVEQQDLPTGKLEESIQELIMHPDRLTAMAGNARQTAKPEATAQIVESIIRLARAKQHVSQI